MKSVAISLHEGCNSFTRAAERGWGKGVNKIQG